MIVKNTSQKTLAKEIQLNGIGLHSGSQIKLHLKQAKKIKVLFLFEPT